MRATPLCGASKHSRPVGVPRRVPRGSASAPRQPRQAHQMVCSARIDSYSNWEPLNSDVETLQICEPCCMSHPACLRHEGPSHSAAQRLLGTAGYHGQQNGVPRKQAYGQPLHIAAVSSIPALTRLCATPHAGQVAKDVLQEFQGRVLCFCAPPIAYYRAERTPRASLTIY